jgi:hypothetical protein
MQWWTFRNKGHDWMSDSPTFDVEHNGLMLPTLRNNGRKQNNSTAKC